MPSKDRNLLELEFLKDDKRGCKLKSLSGVSRQTGPSLSTNE